MMDLEETRAALEGLVGGEVHVSLTERQSDGLTFMETGTPFVGDLSNDESDFIVGQEDDPSKWRFTLGGETFEGAEWSDTPEPDSLQIRVDGSLITITRAAPRE